MIENMNGEMVEELTWANSGLTHLEQLTLRQVARQFPDGAYAKFVKALDEKDTER